MAPNDDVILRYVGLILIVAGFIIYFAWTLTNKKLKKRDLYTVKYLRMCREDTDSWITFPLSKEMNFNQACEWVEKNMPEWEVYSGSLKNPDREDANV